MNEKKDTYLIRLLHIVANRLSIDSLLDLGLQYSQIASLLSEAMKNKFIIEIDDDRLELSQQGYELLDELKEKLYPFKPTRRILPQDEYRIENIGKYDVYLPRRKIE
jgi:hypothetical protein